MKINEEQDSLQVSLQFDSEEEKKHVLSMLEATHKKIMGYHHGKNHFIPVDRIYSIESLEKQTLIYTREQVFDSPLWLYQIEEQLGEDFVRISKQVIVNMAYLESMKADLGSRIIIYLDNGDQFVVNRAYAKAFKRKLGGM